MHISILNLLIPHYCCSCGKIGAVLCEHCKYDIISEPFSRCIVCLRPANPAAQLCSACIAPYTQAWCVGERQDVLERAINRYKYESAKAAGEPLLELLDDTIPRLPPGVIVTAVPTIAPHIRTRGYDHTAHLARKFAIRRGLPYSPVLVRQDSTRQQGSSRSQRLEQAKRAFRCDTTLNGTYLLVDDVYTTGATLHYASKALREAGASEVYVAVLARQPLEKS